jgi:hypothetical protein
MSAPPVSDEPGVKGGLGELDDRKGYSRCSDVPNSLMSTHFTEDSDANARGHPEELVSFTLSRA